jgi:hypothetical protein
LRILGFIKNPCVIEKMLRHERQTLGALTLRLLHAFGNCLGKVVVVEFFAECDAAEREKARKFSLAVAGGIEQMAQ